MKVSLANNGREAVERVEREVFDLVLMDIQMPIMGGYEATGIMKKQHPDLPIIAMTAHAMSGAKEDCLRAGMNDYVTKPIDPRQLFAVLVSWIKPFNKKAIVSSEQVTRHVKPIPAKLQAPTDAEFPRELAGFDVALGLARLGGNKKLYRKLLLEFKKDFAHSPETMRQMIDRGDLSSAARLAHKLKGISGNLSANDVFDVAGRLEGQLTEGENNVGYEDLLIKLDTYLRTTVESIEQNITSD